MIGVSLDQVFKADPPACRQRHVSFLDADSRNPTSDCSRQPLYTLPPPLLELPGISSSFCSKFSGAIFDRAGSYDYICAVHPYMSGKVIVRAP